MQYSFRCKTCGWLEVSNHSCEAEHPHCCRVCSAGVKFDEKGNKTFQSDNWECLGSASPERLAELGLTADEVTKHTPHDPDKVREKDRENIHAQLKAHAEKEQAWESQKLEIVKEYDQLASQLNAIPEQQTAKRASVSGKMKELEGRVYTDRDAAHKKELEVGLAKSIAGQQRSPKHLLREVREGLGGANDAIAQKS